MFAEGAATRDLLKCFTCLKRLTAKLLPGRVTAVTEGDVPVALRHCFVIILWLL